MRRLALLLLLVPAPAWAVCDPVIGVSNWVGCTIDGATDLLECWGTDNNDQLTNVPVFGVSSVDGGDCALCATKLSDGSLVCWGCNTGSVVSGTPGGTGFTYVTPGTCSACALEGDGTVTCWGTCVASYDEAEGSFTYDQIRGDQEQYCGLRTTGAIACWGVDNGDGVMTEPAGTDYAFVDATADHACALKNDASLVCWGSNDQGESTVPAGTYLSVAVVNDATCAIQADGDLDCWTDNPGLSSLLTTPTGSFTDIECSEATCCAVSSAGNVECWGDDVANVVTGSAGEECPAAAAASTYVIVQVGM